MSNDIGDYPVDSNWQAYRASQALTRLDHEELAVMGRYYTQLDGQRGFILREFDAWDVISLLQGDPARLGPTDFTEIRIAIQHARSDNLLIGLAKQELYRAKLLHIPDPAPNTVHLADICRPLPVKRRPIGTPYRHAKGTPSAGLAGSRRREGVARPEA